MVRIFSQAFFPALTAEPKALMALIEGATGRCLCGDCQASVVQTHEPGCGDNGASAGGHTDDLVASRGPHRAEPDGDPGQ